MAQLVDKTELFEKCMDMLLMLESECDREVFSLTFNDAWAEFEDIIMQLRAELEDE